MRTFSILSIAAAAVISLVPTVFAAPAVDAKAGAGAVVAVHDKSVHAVGKDGGKVHARLDARSDGMAGAAVHAREDEDVDECTKILTDLKVNLGVKIDLLHGLKEEEAKKEKILPILKDVVSIIASATVSIKALIGNGIVCNANICAQLLADILVALCCALSFVLSIVADVEILLGCITEVALGDCLCDLIKAVLAVVGGLLTILVPLVLELADVLVKLGLNVVCSILTIL